MKKSIIVMMSLMAVVVSSVVFAGPHFGKHGMHNPLERMLDHIDLTDEQEEKIDVILDRTEVKHDRKKGMRVFKDMISLDPDSANYLQESELKASAAADKMKQHILALAKARQEIYAVLDEEQKEDLKRLLDKKMKRMAKRFEDD